MILIWNYKSRTYNEFLLLRLFHWHQFQSWSEEKIIKMNYYPLIRYRSIVVIYVCHLSKVSLSCGKCIKVIRKFHNESWKC